MNEEKWIDCDFVGVIKKYDNEPKSPKEPVENGLRTEMEICVYLIVQKKRFLMNSLI